MRKSLVSNGKISGWRKLLKDLMLARTQRDMVDEESFPPDGKINSYSLLRPGELSTTRKNAISPDFGCFSTLSKIGS